MSAEPVDAPAPSARALDLLRSPLTLAVIGGILTLLANVVTGAFNTRNELRLERDKFQSDLIKKFLEPASDETRSANLRFLADSGLIPDYGAAVSKYLLAHPDDVPQTVSQGITEQPVGAFGADNRIEDATLDKLNRARKAVFNIVLRNGPVDRVRCSGFLVTPDTIATATNCVPETQGAVGDLTIEGTASDVNAKPAIASFEIVGEGDKRRAVALIKLAQPFADALPLVPASDAPKIGEHLMLVYSSGPGKFVAAYDDECQITVIEENMVAYRCDASPGSGGGPVISMASGNVVAVHSDKDTKARYGPRVDNVEIVGR